MAAAVSVVSAEGVEAATGSAAVSDLRIKVKLTLKEIVNGATKKLKINKQITCDQCGGTGAKDKDSSFDLPDL